ncbi:S1 family peptidase [Gigaspora margarita]|uniref:S1 family peptidase n=1 Tax=Gigaspora margarita TaxID=4874 RepID=A0A8H4AUQ9_GIGMA|nr:S1 family peptidase [Gigaspora margarita]
MIFQTLLFILFIILQNHSIHSQYQPLANLWNVAENEVPELLVREKNLITGNHLLASLLNEENFGESYIDVKSNKIYINILNLSNKQKILEDSKMEKYKDLLEFNGVFNSLANLNSTFNKLISLNYNDKENNDFINQAKKFNVIIRHRGKEEIPTSSVSNYQYGPNQNKRNLIKRSPPSKRPKLAIEVLGGHGLHNNDHNNSYGCSAGFWVFDEEFPEILLLATVGHCAIKGPFKPDGSVDFYYLGLKALMTNTFVGTMETYDFDPIDRGYVAVNTSNTRLSIFPSIINPDSQTYQVQFIVGQKILSEKDIGSTICKSGYRTHVTCGTLRGIHDTYIMDGKTYKSVLEAELFSAEGDSGSPVFQYVIDDDGVIRGNVNIVGLLLAGNSTVNMTLFHPVDKILVDEDIGIELTLLTVSNIGKIR